MDKRERDFILLRLSEGHSATEVAQMTGRSTSTINRYARQLPGHKGRHRRLDVVKAAWSFVGHLNEGLEEDEARNRVAEEFECEPQTIDRLRQWIRTGEKPGGNCSRDYNAPPPQEMVDSYFKKVAPRQSGFLLPPGPPKVGSADSVAAHLLSHMLLLEQRAEQTHALLVRLCAEWGVDVTGVERRDKEASK